MNGFAFVWYILPIISFGVIQFFMNKKHLTHQNGLRTPDLVTPILILSVHFTSKNVLNESLLPYFSLMMLLIAMLIAVFHVKYFKVLNYRRYFKMLWRIAFLVISLIYVIVFILQFIL